MQIVAESMQASSAINVQFSEISEVRKRLQELREEALAWHHTADEKEKQITRLSAEIRQQSIKIDELNARISTLACENVRLLNKNAKDTLRQYDEPTDTFSDK